MLLYLFDPRVLAGWLDHITTIDDLKGFCYPPTPGGISSLVGELPWHYATEYLNIAYCADPQAIAARLPEPLAPGPEPDMEGERIKGVPLVAAAVAVVPPQRAERLELCHKAQI
jgi:hypothetical protein